MLDKPILSKGILEIAFDTCVGVVEKCGRGINNLAEGIGNIGGGNTLSDGGFLTNLKESIGFGDKSPAPQIATERTPAVEITAPAPSLDKYEVSMNELGSFAPPTFGGLNTPSAGRGV
jgi:hypothetical protein